VFSVTVGLSVFSVTVGLYECLVFWLRVLVRKMRPDGLENPSLFMRLCVPLGIKRQGA
jgi:hypothetical protein